MARTIGVLHGGVLLTGYKCYTLLRGTLLVPLLRHLLIQLRRLVQRNALLGALVLSMDMLGDLSECFDLVRRVLVLARAHVRVLWAMPTVLIVGTARMWWSASATATAWMPLAQMSSILILPGWTPSPVRTIEGSTQTQVGTTDNRT